MRYNRYNDYHDTGNANDAVMFVSSSRVRHQILALLGAIVLLKFLSFSVSSMTGKTP